jgi:hypothetical protein
MMRRQHILTSQPQAAQCGFAVVLPGYRGTAASWLKDITSENAGAAECERGKLRALHSA